MIEIHNDKENDYRFSIRAESGNILLKSKTFSEKRQIDNTLQNLGTTTIKRSHFERKTDHDGKFLFYLKDNDGNLIGSSELYDSEAGMENGIKNLQNRIASLSKNN